MRRLSLVEGCGRTGIVLVLVSGIVTLLAVLALSMGSIVRIAAVRGERDRALSASRLAAGSGMEYAAARLMSDPLPRRIGDPVARGDDWTFRDLPLTVLGRATNPSYSHGEAWQEQGGSPGAYDPGADLTGSDADGDGSFSAWTGRLRGVRARFSLKIGSLDGRIPLNGGHLHDPGFVFDLNNPSQAYYQNTAHWPHFGIEQALNGLADVLGYGSAGIGNNLFVHRPEGGYRSWQEVERTLLALAYPLPLIDALRPFVDLEPRQTEWGTIPLCMRGAPRETLEALWRAAFLYADSKELLDPNPAPAGVGYAFKARVGAYFERNLADLSLRFLEGDEVDWGAFRHRLLSEAGMVFAIDAAGWKALEDGDWDPAAEPSESGSLEFDTLAKRTRFQLQLAAWAYQLVSSDAFPFDGTPPEASCFRTWATGGIEGDGTPGGRAAPLARSFGNLLRLTLAPPTRFAIESRGLCAGGEAEAGGNLRAAETLEWTTQEDFEGWEESRLAEKGSSTFLSRRGISLVQDPSPADRHDWDGLAGAPRVVSLPARSIWATAQPYVAEHPFNGRDGALTLGGFRRGRGTSQLYWGFPDDFDGVLDGEIDSEQDDKPDPLAPFPWALPAPPYQILFGIGSNHHEVSGSEYIQSPGFDAPMDALDGYADQEAPPPPRQDSRRTALRELCFEGWFGPGSSVKLIEGGSGGWIQLGSRRSLPADQTPPGVFFFVNVVRWPRGCWTFGTPGAAGGQWTHFVGDPISGGDSWFVPDPPSGASGTYHVLLTVRREGKGWINRSTVAVAGIPSGGGEPYRTRFTLRVDGQPTGDWVLSDPNAPTLQEKSGGLNLNGTSGEAIEIVGIDELRIYARPPASFPSVGDRFLDYGTFTSPLYRLDAPAKLLQSQWWGWVPADRGEPVSAELVPCDALGNALGAPAPLGGRGEIRDLTGAAGSPVRAFRYRVHFDCAAWPKPLREVPVFESIWVAFRRGPPRWSGVSLR